MLPNILALSAVLEVLSFAQANDRGCQDIRFPTLSPDFGNVVIVQKVEIIAPFSIYYMQTEISKDQTTRTQLRSTNGPPLVVYSSLDASSVEWVTLNVIARKLFFVPVNNKDLPYSPYVLATVCRYDTPVSYFNDKPYTVEIHEAGLVSSFDNLFIAVFRTFENGIFIFSMHDEGDLLVVQIVDGTIYVIYDFGTLAQSVLSGGMALNDGEWHEVKWIHTYDKVKLVIDGALVNQSSPAGYSKRLDLDEQIHIAGRPPDNEKSPIESSFHGCLARIELNKVDLLARAPLEKPSECQMPKPQLMTINPGAFASMEFKFFPFSIEFRILPQPSTVLVLQNSRLQPLVEISINSKGLLVLTAGSLPNEQLSNPARYRHSCEEHFMVNQKRVLSEVTLDLDGGHPLKPFSVQCERKIISGVEEIITIISHDLEANGVFISGTTEPGNIKRTIDYHLEAPALDRFMDGFENCKQYMRFECMGGTKLMSYGEEKRPSSWYSIRNGEHGLQWGDAPPFSHMCSCAMNASAICVRNGLCNCDSGENTVDEGFNTHLRLLPVMALYLGGTSPTSSLNVSIGPLTCYNKAVDTPVVFSNRDASLYGEELFNFIVFDISMMLRFSHSHVTIFCWESENQQRWFQLFAKDGHLTGQVVNGKITIEIRYPRRINDTHWHMVYWEVNSEGMLLNVDGDSVTETRLIIMPQLSRWIIGSRIGDGESGFAGAIRSVYLCGKELLLKNQLQQQPDVRGIRIGDVGACRPGACINGGKCVDYFDSFKCNCSDVPFAGERCEQDVGMSVTNGTELEIAWQHPGHTAPCFRIAVMSPSSSYSLIRAKAHFAEAQLNLTVNDSGDLDVSAYDGLSAVFKQTSTGYKLNSYQITDVKFCGTEQGFTLHINGEKSITSTGNWSFFEHLNVWKFLDDGFEGCVMRLQVGRGFPFKDPSSTRLLHKEKIRRGTCPFDQEYYLPKLAVEEEALDSGIRVVTVRSTASLVGILTPIIGIIAGSTVFLLVLVVVCWIRNRPDGVYKTNEDIHAYCSPSRSEEPLVAGNIVNTNKEYFC